MTSIERPRVYKRDGNWWVSYAIYSQFFGRHVFMDACFARSYCEAQAFANRHARENREAR